MLNQLRIDGFAQRIANFNALGSVVAEYTDLD